MLDRMERVVSIAKQNYWPSITRMKAFKWFAKPARIAQLKQVEEP
jgi:hypothetical protein